MTPIKDHVLISYTNQGIVIKPVRLHDTVSYIIYRIAGNGASTFLVGASASEVKQQVEVVNMDDEMYI